jgi:class 3 adenylate cyclase
MGGETRIAERLPSVCILFADIVGFTEYAANLQPDVVLERLEVLFQQIDRIVERHGCKRVKTIGDSYMASSGSTAEETDEHAVRMARAALEIVDIARSSSTQFSLRIGVHIGPVVAGVMQGMLLAYDMWGDTVNVAARLETSSSPGRIHISKPMADALLQSAAASEFSIVLRGDTELKGRGVVQTFWLGAATPVQST